MSVRLSLCRRAGGTMGFPHAIWLQFSHLITSVERERKKEKSVGFIVLIGGGDLISR